MFMKTKHLISFILTGDAAVQNIQIESRVYGEMDMSDLTSIFYDAIPVLARISNRSLTLPRELHLV